MNFFEKTSSTSVYLSPDSTTWVKTVITNFLQKFPALQQMPIVVNWVKTEFDKGFAVGTLDVFGGHIPVIIRDFKLYPLDVILFENAAIPLTPETMNELLTNPSPFKGALDVKTKSSLNIFGDGVMNLSPVDTAGRENNGMSQTRDAVKVASVNKSVMASFINAYLEEDLSVQEKLASFLDKLDSIAISPDESVEMTEFDRSYKFTDELGNSFVKSASSKFDVETVTELSVTEAKAFMPKLAELPKNIEITEKTAENELEVGKTGKFTCEGSETPGFTILSIDKSTKIEKFASLSYYDSSGTLLINKTGNYFDVADQLRVDSDNLERISYSEPSIGDFGVFEVNHKVSKPFTVNSIMKIANFGKKNQDFIVGDTGFSKIAFYFEKNTKNEFVSHETEKNGYYVPKNAKFIKLGRKLPGSENEMKKLASQMLVSHNSPFVVKIAGLTGSRFTNYEVYDTLDKISYDSATNTYSVPKSADFVEIYDKKIEKIAKVAENYIKCDSVGLYSFTGPEIKKFEKLGHNITDLSKEDAVWTLVKLGGVEDDILALNELKKNAACKTKGKLKSPSKKKTVKVANVVKPVYMFKAAAVLNDQSSVDSILSLGLMTDDNLAEYIESIPEYERVVGELCKLLISSRLGANLDENILTNAVQNLTKVVYMLKQLKGLINK